MIHKGRSVGLSDKNFGEDCSMEKLLLASESNLDIFSDGIRRTWTLLQRSCGSFCCVHSLL